MLLIKNYNRNESISLPYEKGCYLLGNDIYTKEMILEAIKKYFSGKKTNEEVKQYLDGEDIEIYLNNKKIQSKEYCVYNISPFLDLESEISISKSSILRKGILKALNEVFEYDPQLNYINDLLEDMLKGLYSGEINNLISNINSSLGDKLKLNYLVKGIEINNFVDSLFSLEIIKDDSPIPIAYLSYKDQLLIYIGIIKNHINIVEEGKKFIIICDDLECKLSDEEVKEVLREFDEFKTNPRVDIILSSRNGRNITLTSGNIETVSIINKNKQLKFFDYDSILKDIEMHYYRDIDSYKLEESVSNVIANYSDIICEELGGYNAVVEDEEIRGILNVLGKKIG